MCSSRIAIIPLIFTIEESADIRPNIMGKYWFMSCRSGWWEGALVQGERRGTAYNGPNNPGNYAGVNLDASAGDPTYGKATTIQPSSGYAFIMIKA